MRSRPLRVMGPLLCLVLVGAVCGREPSALRVAPSEVMERACELPADQVKRIWRGYDPDRSGEVQIVAQEPAQVGDYLPHAGPWDYLQEIPLVLYGPGHVRPIGKVDRPTTLADVAPTLGMWLGMRGLPTDGRPLVEAVEERDEPPRLILTVVWDGGGRNVLEEHRDSWPNLRRLMREGAWFPDATVGSSPSLTGAAHATLGTGLFPRHHGRVDHHLRINGRIVESKDEGTSDLRVPTIAERWDEREGGEPQVGLIATEPWHLGMIGRGTSKEGGDGDVVFLNTRGEWRVPAPYRSLFETPRYGDRIPQPDPLAAPYDLEDGAADGAWRGDPVRLRDVSFSFEQTRLLQRMIRRHGFGSDDLTDLLFVNYKRIDKVGHGPSMNSPDMEVVIRATDEALGKLVRILDREVGAGRWVLVVTADHGSAPSPSLSGAFVVNEGKLVVDIEERFGGGDDTPVLERQRPTQIWLDSETLVQKGRTPMDVARFLLGYTKGDNRGDPSTVPGDIRDDPVFAAAFPSEMLLSAPCWEAIREEGVPAPTDGG